MNRSASFAKEANDVGNRSTGAEYASDAQLQQSRDIGLRNNATDHDLDVSQSGFLEQIQNPRHESEMSAAKEAEAEPLGVLIGHGPYHCFRRLPQPCVDDVHARVAQASRYDLDASVVTIQPYLGEDDAEWCDRLRHEVQ
jgi:hypothetical protein